MMDPNNIMKGMNYANQVSKKVQDFTEPQEPVDDPI